MENIPVLLASKVAHTLMYAKLNRPHQGRGFELLVRHFPTLDPTVAQLLTLQHLLGVVG